MLQNAIFLMPKNAEKFECQKCYFKCSKLSNYNKHLSTLKHKMLQNAIYLMPKNADNILCNNCNKKFNHLSSMYRHRKKCLQCVVKKPHNEVEVELPVKTSQIIEIVKQNQEFKQLLIEQNQKITEQNNKLMELAKEGKHIINNNNTNNTNNFNLNVFLNETCKDAINLVDFVDSLQVQLHDLEETARLGYAEGISRIFIKGLNNLDFHKRPIHCNDSKRDILYIKDNGNWEKEDQDKSHITLAIKQIGNKNMKQIPIWQKAHPDYNNPCSKQNDKYMKLILNTMSGSTKEEQQQNINKVIKNISKEVVIDKKIST